MRFEPSKQLTKTPEPADRGAFFQSIERFRTHSTQSQSGQDGHAARTDRADSHASRQRRGLVTGKALRYPRLTT